ncbi:alpha-N-arabinofuranosidase [Duganella callida]|uniref:non-reducing end alpha-L-arabinofuranosidase n=1 Tax=Duganella callida TaxID=2561932 RepID=A0A4Y9S962_9BURK|nr:alpha-L-arabinofuranosidase C-terminal domain-containing protein [Duganella callida]TFW16655.1 alpha-N-arabinofuranosidase [Duganella callida]
MNNPLILLAGLVLSAALSATAADRITVTIDPAADGPTISRHLFGQFAEHLGHGIYGGVWVGRDSPIPNTRGIRNDVVAALKAIQVPNVRWPGGCFADEYHWRNGIGPASQRRAGRNPNWGGVVEPNTFGTDEFMDFVGQIGADAYISANVGSGTRQEAAEWLEYLTAEQTALGDERAANGHKAPYKVAFWGIGNESWGCGGAMSAAHYLEELKMYSHFSRNYNPAQVMQQIAVGPDGAKTEYTETIMRAWAGKVWSWDIAGLSLHSYTLNGWPPSVKATGFGEPEYARFIQETLGMDDLIRKHGAIMDRYDPQKKVALVVDEWGAWLAPTPGTDPGFLMQQNSQRDAIVAALNLNIFARHAARVRMANIAQMVNVLQAMILTDQEKMVLTPTYHVFRMYVPFHDATLLPARFKPERYRYGKYAMPRVDAMAARDANGKLWVALTNIDYQRPVEIALAVSGRPAVAVSGQILAAPQADSVNTFAAPDTVTPQPLTASMVQGRPVLTLAPRSVAVVAVEQ